MLGSRYATVGLQLPVHVAEAGGQLDAFGDTEGEPHGLACTMVGVLPKDYHPHLVKGDAVEGPAWSKPQPKADRSELLEHSDMAPWKECLCAFQPNGGDAEDEI